MGKTDFKEIPITHSMFLILCALGEPNHGYAIMKQIDHMTRGEYPMGPATLYSTTKQLLKAQLIEEVASADPRRRTYAMTDTGRAVLRKEAMSYTRLGRIGLASLEGKESTHDEE